MTAKTDTKLDAETLVELQPPCDALVDGEGWFGYGRDWTGSGLTQCDQPACFIVVLAVTCACIQPPPRAHFLTCTGHVWPAEDGQCMCCNAVVRRVSVEPL